LCVISLWRDPHKMKLDVNSVVQASICMLGLLGAGANGEGMELDEGAWALRDLMPRYSLGPAPFPHPTQMDYELFGDAFAQDDSIKVTDDKQHQKGAIWSKYTLPPNLQNWQTDLKFRVGGQSGDFFGDGFALWFVQERGIGGEALGGPDEWNGIGIFFDTYKNDAFKGKRHPYVYVIPNDGKININRLERHQIESGCHIPFRHSEELRTTIARVTLNEKNRLTVIMQPEGADDWVQCVDIASVELPENLYIGITAMTGDLVDKHHMVSIKAYTNVKTDPMSYAHKNDEFQMPDMWDAMRESGHLAREYENWEKEIMEDTEFDPSEGEDAYQNYYDHHDEDDDDHHDEDDDDHHDEDDDDHHDEDDDDHHNEEEAETHLTRAEKLKRRREQYEQRKKNKKSGDDKTPTYREDMKQISQLLEGTEIGKKFNKLHKEHREKMKMLREHLESDMAEAVHRLTGMVREIRVKEHYMNTRIQNLAEKLHVELIQPMKEESKNAGGGWFWPFLIFLMVIAGIAVFGYRRYKSFMKTHLL